MGRWGGRGEMWDLGELKHRDTTSLLSTSMALSHQFIWSSTNLMLCFMRSGGSSLAWPTTAGDEESRRQDAVRLRGRGFQPPTRSCPAPTHGPWLPGRQCPCLGSGSGTQAVWASAPPFLPWVVQGLQGVQGQCPRGWRHLLQPQALFPLPVVS